VYPPRSTYEFSVARLPIAWGADRPTNVTCPKSDLLFNCCFPIILVLAQMRPVGLRVLPAQLLLRCRQRTGF
jgi:hypothetical protein